MTEPSGVERPDQRPEPSVAGSPGGVWRIGHAEFDELSGWLKVGEQASELDHTGQQLLTYLLHNAGKVATKDELLKTGWPGRIATETSLTKAIHRLRQALRDPDGHLLCTVHGYGYRLATRVEFVPVAAATASQAVAASTTMGKPRMKVWRLVAWTSAVLASIAVALILALKIRAPAAVVDRPAAVTTPSLVVLPFRDLSQAHDQAHLAEGLTEELRNRLAQSRALRVIGPTTSSTLSAPKLDVRAVGKMLGVSHMLQGSVRSSGQRVRITTHLVRTADSVDVWSKVYDRDPGELFALQDEISGAVASQLKVQLLGRSKPRHRPDPRAYTLVQKSRHLERLGTGTLDQYAPMIREAVSIDPQYSDAWYILGVVYLDEVNAGRREPEAGIRLARSAYEKALALDPENVVVYALLGNLSNFYEGNPARGAKYFEQALALEPGNLKVLFMGAALANSLGRTDDAIRAIEYVVDRDPVDAYTQSVLGYFYYKRRRWDDAIDRFQTALALSAEMQYANAALGDALRQKGQPRAALAAFEKENDERYRLYGLVVANHALGRKGESDQALRTLLAKYGAVKDDGESYWLVATALAQRGDADGAFEWLGKASGLATHDLVNDVELRPLHSDPRWQPFLQKHGKTPEQLAVLQRIKFDLAVPGA